MTFRKFLFFQIIFFLLGNIFSPAMFPAEKTIIKEINGKTVYFDIPDGAQYNEIEAGLFIEKLDNYTASVEINGKRVKAYIADNLRDYEINPYAWVLLNRNERKEYKTEWDIISIGYIETKIQPTNTILLQPPGVERKTTEPFQEATLAPLNIATDSTLPGGVEGTAYSVTLFASGGTPPYMWSLVSGSLPSGLSLSSDGVISGTPSGNTPGTTYSFTVQVTDSVSATADKILGVNFL